MTKAKAKTYKVTYERIEDGWWLANVHGHGVQGVFTDGRSIEEARRRVREPLALAIGDDEAEAAVLEDSFPAAITGTVAKLQKARVEAAAASHRVVELQQRAARELTEQHGLSVRDAGALLGLSGAMVHRAARGVSSSKVARKAKAKR